MSAFFVSLLFTLLSVPAFAKNCQSNHLSPPERAVVKWVYDGDTIRLTDKRKIRIIGIDTPETKHHKQKAQAYAGKAREALRELLKKDHYRVLLRYAKDRVDRYSRTLAHVYLYDGTNLSNWLLEHGFAKTLAYPPNIRLADCYRDSERYAQARSKGIWRLKKNKVRDADSLALRVKGFVRLKGRVKRIFRHKRATIIELVSKTSNHIQLRIKKSNLSYFKSIVPDKLWNKEIIVSGILRNKRNRRTLYLNHPSQIEISQRRNIVTKKKEAETILKWSTK